MLLEDYRRFRRLILLGGTSDFLPERMRALDNDEVLFREELTAWEALHIRGLDTLHIEINNGLAALRHQLTVPQLHDDMRKKIGMQRAQVPEFRALLNSAPMLEEPFQLPPRSPTRFIDTLRIMWIMTDRNPVWREVFDSHLAHRPRGRPYDISPERHLWLTREWLAINMQPLLIFRRYIDNVDDALNDSKNGSAENARNAAAIEQFQLASAAAALLVNAPAMRSVLHVPDDDRDLRHLVAVYDEALPH